jgi:uncharacterized protein YbjT (DUF2867 family)
MFVVAGASGNTGKVVAESLLAKGKGVRVVVRDPKKGEAWRARGAEVAVAELDDVRALTAALAGAEGAYLLLPPRFESTHVRADNARRTEVLAKAVDATGVKHVVFLSSLGAERAEGTGPITALYDAERALSKLRADITFLRAAYFMENWGGSLYALAQGTLPTFLLADRAIPMVASADIGTAAAGLLVEGGRGKRVVDLGGPREYSPRDVAAALGRVVGKPIAVQQGPEEAMVPALTGAGLNAEWARLYQEMTHATNTGEVTWGQGHARLEGRTEIDVVLKALTTR